jgi:hypothetical protein
MQRLHDPLHSIFEIRVGVLVGRRVGMRIGEVRDRDVDMPTSRTISSAISGFVTSQGSANTSAPFSRNNATMSAALYSVGSVTIARLPKNLPATVGSFHVAPVMLFDLTKRNQRASHSARLAPRGMRGTAKKPGVYDMTTWSVMP